MNHSNTYETIKKDFCHLFYFKSHGNTLEVITPLVTLTDKFVSIFVTQRGNNLIITDGGWINQEVYGHTTYHDDKEIVWLAINQYKAYYNINQTNGNGHTFYFRSVDRVELLSAAVFDLANFIVGVVNSFTLEYKEKKEIEERDRFKSETNDFFKEHYNERFDTNKEIINGVKYNGVLSIANKLHLFEYVTGSSNRYFEQDLRKAIINFQLIEENPVMEYVGNRIAIFNDQSLGYQNGIPPILVEHLEKSTSHILTRTNRDKVFSIISPN